MRKILIIDADMDFLNSLSSDLRAAGYEVETSSFAAAGLEKALGVSLVIVSVELPDQNGFVVCSHLKGNPATASIPVFITSSADSTAAFERHLNLANHADGYFLKPLDVAAMLQEMAAIFAEIDAGYAMGAEASEPGYAGAEMIDVSDPAEEVAASDDSEVIKALSVDDMNLFGDIDANELSGAEVLGFNEPAAPVSAAPAPVSAAPVSAAPVSSVSAAPKLPPRAGSPAATGLPSIGASPAKPVAEKPAGQATITGMPASKSGQGLPRIPAKPANFSTTISNSRIPVSGDFKRPSASISSVSQTAIPAADLSRLNDEITVLNNEITVLKSEITTRDNRITMLQSQCDALTARCNNAEAIASALQTEAEQALQARAEAEAALGEAQAALVQTQTSEAALAEKIAHLTALMDQIQSVLKS
ncbi:MAG: two-component system response regulator [Bradymonadia bacterium]